MGAACTRSRWLLYSTFFLGLVITFSGCSRTVTGGFTDSPDKKYRVYGRVFGAYGHAFVDNTAKTIRVSIVASDGQETLLFRKEYHVKGSDVGWDATWDKQDNLTMIFYDSGPGVLSSEGTAKGRATNHIRTVSYRFDSKAVTFTEETAK